jgi:hypothetical protein
MRTVNFKISPDAARFISEMILWDKTKDMVLTISRTASAGRLPRTTASLEDDIRAYVQANQGRISSDLVFSWSVGGATRSRFRKVDIVVVDGIPAVIPKHLAKILDGRTLVLAGNELVFEPEIIEPE